MIEHVQSILDAAVRYADSIFQNILIWINIDNTNITLLEILSIILRILRWHQHQRLHHQQLTMKKPTQMIIVVVVEVEAEVVVVAEVPEEKQKIIKRKVDTDATTEQDAIKLCCNGVSGF